MTAQWMIHLPVLAALVWMAATDLRCRKIRNVVTLPLLVAGLVQSFLFFGTVTPEQAFYGLAIGFLVTFVMFCIGGIGGGDVKLIAALGAWTGPTAIVHIMIVTAILSMVMALIQCAIKGELKVLFRSSAVLAISAANIRTVGVDHAADAATSCRVKSKPLPVAVPVLLAWIGVILAPLIWRGF